MGTAALPLPRLLACPTARARGAAAAVPGPGLQVWVLGSGVLLLSRRPPRRAQSARRWHCRCHYRPRWRLKMFCETALRTQRQRMVEVGLQHTRRMAVGAGAGEAGSHRRCSMRYSRWNQQIEEGEERDQHLLLRVKHPRNLVPPSPPRQFLWLRLERRRSAVLDKGISISSSSTRLLASARRWAPQRQQLLPLLPLLLLELLLEREQVLLVLLVLVHLQVA